MTLTTNIKRQNLPLISFCFCTTVILKAIKHQGQKLLYKASKIGVAYYFRRKVGLINEGSRVWPSWEDKGGVLQI